MPEDGHNKNGPIFPWAFFVRRKTLPAQKICKSGANCINPGIIQLRNAKIMHSQKTDSNSAMSPLSQPLLIIIDDLYDLNVGFGPR